MKVPRVFYGSHAEVKKRCRKLIRRLKKGETWLSIMDELDADLMDIDDDPEAYLIVTGRSIQGAVTSFGLSTLFLEIDIKEGTWGALANETVLSSLTKEWGMLLVLAPSAGWVEARHVAILEALQRHWSALVAVGKRYSCGGLTPGLLNEQPTVIQFVLGNNGVDPDSLRGSNEPTLDYLQSQLPVALEHARNA